MIVPMVDLMSGAVEPDVAGGPALFGIFGNGAEGGRSIQRRWGVLGYRVSQEFWMLDPWA